MAHLTVSIDRFCWSVQWVLSLNRDCHGSIKCSVVITGRRHVPCTHSFSFLLAYSVLIAQRIYFFLYLSLFSSSSSFGPSSIVIWLLSFLFTYYFIFLFHLESLKKLIRVKTRLQWQAELLCSPLITFCVESYYFYSCSPVISIVCCILTPRELSFVFIDWL